jgi:hypothetical protein
LEVIKVKNKGIEVTEVSDLPTIGKILFAGCGECIVSDIMIGGVKKLTTLLSSSPTQTSFSVPVKAGE